ncbi:hypothetical protein [Streptomyces sp. NPDC058613]|uniref:hypothetical protein n=1 Tax=unclassified Streptomyces TaxID=2593676 RepID=UPI003653C218
MLIAQSAWVTASQTIPVAALTTVLLGAFLAPWIAKRQEGAKRQVEAEAALRELVSDLRSDVMYARERLDVASNYDPKRFGGQRLVEFTIRSVEAARKLSRRQQRKLRPALAELVGDGRVLLAEEIGTAVVRTYDDDSFSDPKEREQVAHHFTVRAIETEVQIHGLDREKSNGLLGMMERSALPHEDHPEALAALDRLLKIVQGSPRLGS